MSNLFWECLSAERRKAHCECCLESLLRAGFKRGESYGRHLRGAAEKLYEMNKCLSLVHLTRRHGAPERGLILVWCSKTSSYSVDTRAFYSTSLRIHFFEDEVARPPRDPSDPSSLTTTNLLRCLTARRGLVQLLLQLQELTQLVSIGRVGARAIPWAWLR